MKVSIYIPWSIPKLIIIVQLDMDPLRDMKDKCTVNIMMNIG